MRIILGLLFISLFCSTLHADEAVNTLKALASKVEEITLDNGMRVLIYRRGVAPVFAGVVVVRVGGSDEVVGHTGIAHMLEHMAFKGTPRIGTRDYAKEKDLLAELEKLAALSDGGRKLDSQEQARWDDINLQLSKLWVNNDFINQFQSHGASGINATTDSEQTKYFVNLPKSAFEFWCYMESERLLRPVLRQFYQERDVVMEERRMRSEDSPAGKLYELLLSSIYTRHSYRNPVIGYDNDIQHLTATMVNEFRKRFYVPSNIVLSVVGDIDREHDLPLIKKYFERIPAGEHPSRPSIDEPEQRGERHIKLKADASPLLYIAYRKVQYPDPDDIAISVMSRVFAGSEISVLYKELVKKRRIAADIGMDEIPGMAYPNALLFAASPKAPYTNHDLKVAFDKVLQDFIDKGANVEDVEIAKRALKVSYLTQLNSNIHLAKDLASFESLYGDWRVVIDWFEKVSAVTVEDVNRVAKKYLVSDARTIAELENNERD